MHNLLCSSFVKDLNCIICSINIYIILYTYYSNSNSSAEIRTEEDYFSIQDSGMTDDQLLIVHTVFLVSLSLSTYTYCTASYMYIYPYYIYSFNKKIFNFSQIFICSALGE